MDPAEGHVFHLEERLQQMAADHHENGQLAHLHVSPWTATLCTWPGPLDGTVRLPSRDRLASSATVMW
ncbi:MAG: hypothetical protein AAF970_19520 [Bacteroidota bacterium]